MKPNSGTKLWKEIKVGFFENKCLPLGLPIQGYSVHYKNFPFDGQPLIFLLVKIKAGKGKVLAFEYLSFISCFTGKDEGQA
jgi:hypothetical protein